MVVQNTVSVQTPINVRAASEFYETPYEVVQNSRSYGISFSGDPCTKSLMLFKAVQHNQHVLVAQNLEEGADIEVFYPMENIDSRTPLRVASRDGNIRLMRVLLEGGASIFGNNITKDRWSALHSAAYHGKETAMKLLMTESEEIHENIDVDGFGIMHVISECVNAALPNGGADILKFAIGSMHTVSLNKESTRLGFGGWTAMHILAARGKMKSIIQLLKAGAELHCRTGDFLLYMPGMKKLSAGDIIAHCGMHRNDIDNASEHLIDAGLLPIHLAALGGHLRTFQFLIQHGQNVNATTQRYRWTPLFFAVWNGHANIVKEICRSGGRRFINCTDRRSDSQWTPLSLAVLRCDSDMIQLLVAYGADPLVRLMQTDFPGAEYTKHTPEAGSDNWSTTDYRVSLLHLAVIRGNQEILDTIVPIMRTAHFTPIKLSSVPLTGPAENIPPDSIMSRVSLQPLERPSSNIGREALMRQRKKTGSLPAEEANDYSDPLLFQTSEGWSPISLALQLCVVDPDRNLSHAFTSHDIEIKKDNPKSTRDHIFLSLLKTKIALRERTGLPPPVLPSKFNQNSEQLCITVMKKFITMCRSTRDPSLYCANPGASPDDENESKPQYPYNSTPRTSGNSGNVIGNTGTARGNPQGNVANSAAKGSNSAMARAIMNGRNPNEPASSKETDLTDDSRIPNSNKTSPGKSTPGKQGSSGAFLGRQSTPSGTRKGVFADVFGNSDFKYEETLMQRITHATFIAAAHSNRMTLAKALLDLNVCDPNCTAIFPIELRPLHIVSASGFGQFTQMLIDYRADPTQPDENGRKPVEKLHVYYNCLLRDQSAKISELQHFNHNVTNV